MNKTIKVNALLLSALSVFVPASSLANVPITEYVEGSSNNKALEISNLVSVNVDSAAQGDKQDAFANGDGEANDGLCLNCPDITKVADAASFVDSDYYADAIVADTNELRSAIHAAISANHKALTYSEVWSVLTYSDQDPDNSDNVIELYTGKSIAKWSNGSGEQSSNQDAWNREHVWSKSHGFPEREQLGYTDAHHIRPADVSMNSTRSNYDFDNGGNAVQEAPENFYSNELGTWEPRDAVKGDVARMMFYMDVRYEGDSKMPDLKLVNKIGTESGSPEFGKLCTLYDWHLTDVVDAFEQNRNNVVYEYQGNRNPFVDHPEWVDALFHERCTGNMPPEIFTTGQTSVYDFHQVEIDASGSTDENGDTLTFHWQQTSGPSVSFDQNAAVLSFTPPDVNDLTKLVFLLTVSDGQESITKEITISVTEPPENGASGGGSMPLLTLLLLPLFVLRKKLKA